MLALFQAEVIWREGKRCGSCLLAACSLVRGMDINTTMEVQQGRLPRESEAFPEMQSLSSFLGEE